MWKKQKNCSIVWKDQEFKALWYNNNNDTKKAIGKKKNKRVIEYVHETIILENQFNFMSWWSIMKVIFLLRCLMKI